VTKTNESSLIVHVG